MAACVLNELLVCVNCGRPGKAGRKQMCKAKCGSLCHECGEQLVKKQRLPEGKWWWWCGRCHEARHECVSCNMRP